MSLCAMSPSTPPRRSRFSPGMVTSNVRHSRRALVAPPVDATPLVEREVSDIIPSLNFSIPIARLQPLWDFVETSGTPMLLSCTWIFFVSATLALSAPFRAPSLHSHSDACHLHALDRTAAAIGAVWSLQDVEFAPQPSRTPPAARTLPPAALDELRRRAAL